MPADETVHSGREQNFLLAALPDDEWERIGDRFEPHELRLKDVQYHAGEPIRDVWFPMTCVLSMINKVDGEPPVEVATIGREGMAGLPVFLGAPTGPHTVFAQMPGTALRLSAEGLRQVLLGDGALHRQLHRYVQATMVQLAQNVACNRLHTTEERAARWLLMTADRVGAPTFLLTQEFLAQMLGVRRATVSLTAGLLQQAGMIGYRRGVITIQDRPALEDAACDCYHIVHAEFEGLRKPA